MVILVDRPACCSSMALPFSIGPTYTFSRSGYVPVSHCGIQYTRRRVRLISITSVYDSQSVQNNIQQFVFPIKRDHLIGLLSSLISLVRPAVLLNAASGCAILLSAWSGLSPISFVCKKLLWLTPRRHSNFFSSISIIPMHEHDPVR